MKPKRPLSEKARRARQENGRRMHERLDKLPVSELSPGERALRQELFTDEETKRRFKEYLRG